MPSRVLPIVVVGALGYAPQPLAPRPDPPSTDAADPRCVAPCVGDACTLADVPPLVTFTVERTWPGAIGDLAVVLVDPVTGAFAVNAACARVNDGDWTPNRRLLSCVAPRGTWDVYLSARVDSEYARRSRPARCSTGARSIRRSRGRASRCPPRCAIARTRSSSAWTRTLPRASRCARGQTAPS